MGKKTYKFELLKGVGPHFEPNPDFNPDEAESEENFRDREYTEGDTIVSTRALDKLFVNKFIPKGEVKPGQSAGGDSPHPQHDPNKDRPVRSEEDARVNRPDRHLEEDELDDPKLKKLARGKSKIEEEEEEVESEEEEGEEDEGPEAEDVTSEFDGAKDGGLSVMKVGNRYHVHEEGEDEPMKGSKKGFTTKKKTALFIRDNVKTEEDEE